jgi:hypothetical protein
MHGKGFGYLTLDFTGILITAYFEIHTMEPRVNGQSVMAGKSKAVNTQRRKHDPIRPKIA